MRVAALDDVFCHGDVFNMLVASRFQLPECTTATMSAKSLEFIQGGNSQCGIITEVTQGVLLSQFPEWIFGIDQFLHVDMSPSVLCSLWNV